MKSAFTKQQTDTPRDLLLVRADEMEAALPHLPQTGWETAKITLLGITATSTSGILGATHNWISKAREKARGA